MGRNERTWERAGMSDECWQTTVYCARMWSGFHQQIPAWPERIEEEDEERRN